MPLKLTIRLIACMLLISLQLNAKRSDKVLPGNTTKGSNGTAKIDRVTMDSWSAPYRGWHYFAKPVIPADHKIQGYEKLGNFDVPTVYQITGQKGKWFMSFIGFN